MKIKSLNIPLYRGKFIVVITKSPAKIKKYIPDFDDENIYAHSYYANYKKKQGFYIILNFKSQFGKVNHGTIAHEAVHTAHFIMKSRGIIEGFDNDEAEAYLVEWITDQVYKFIKKIKYKVK